MIDYRLEALICILLIVILIIVINPIMIVFFTDVLPTNKNMEVSEVIDRITSKDSKVEYIVSSDYLYIVETKNDNRINEYHAYKGKTSGYIPTTLTYGTGDQVKVYSKTRIIEDARLLYYLKKHRDKYILEFTCLWGDITLRDDMGKTIDAIGIRYFHVVENISEDCEIRGTYNGKEFIVVNKEFLLKHLGDIQ